MNKKKKKITKENNNSQSNKCNKYKCEHVRASVIKQVVVCQYSSLRRQLLFVTTETEDRGGERFVVGMRKENEFWSSERFSLRWNRV